MKSPVLARTVAALTVIGAASACSTEAPQPSSIPSEPVVTSPTPHPSPSASPRPSPTPSPTPEGATLFSASISYLERPASSGGSIALSVQGVAESGDPGATIACSDFTNPTDPVMTDGHFSLSLIDRTPSLTAVPAIWEATLTATGVDGPGDYRGSLVLELEGSASRSFDGTVTVSEGLASGSYAVSGDADTRIEGDWNCFWW